MQISDYAILGGFVGVHQFCRIGTHAFVGNSLGITRDIPPYVMVAGPPAAPRGINSEGLKRRGFSKEQLASILPRDKWIEINELLVLYGQQTCTPLSPHCSRCDIAAHCERIGVERSR